MTSFRDATTLTRTGGHFEITFPHGWLLGRGVFGGLSFAALARAMTATEDAPARPLRSLSCHVPAPVRANVPTTIDVDVLRRGSHVSVLRATLRQGDDVCAHAVGVFAGSRPTTADVGWQDLVPPPSPPWRDLPIAPSGPVEFMQNFEIRILEGTPGDGSGLARSSGWVRPNVRGAEIDAAYIAAVIDTWWPAALVRMPTFRPMSTIEYTLEILVDPSELDAESPLLYRGVSPACRDGYAVEHRELWTEDGRLVALNEQTFVVIQ